MFEIMNSISVRYFSWICFIDSTTKIHFRHFYRGQCKLRNPISFAAECLTVVSAFERRNIEIVRDFRPSHRTQHTSDNQTHIRNPSLHIITPAGFSHKSRKFATKGVRGGEYDKYDKSSPNRIKITVGFRERQRIRHLAAVPAPLKC